MRIGFDVVRKGRNVHRAVGIGPGLGDVQDCAPLKVIGVVTVSDGDVGRCHSPRAIGVVRGAVHHPVRRHSRNGDCDFTLIAVGSVSARLIDEPATPAGRLPPDRVPTVPVLPANRCRYRQC